MFYHITYRLIAAELSRQKELDADLKAIHQIEFVGQLKELNANYNATDEAGNVLSMFVLTFKKNQRNEIKIFLRKFNSVIKYAKLSRSES